MNEFYNMTFEDDFINDEQLFNEKGDSNGEDETRKEDRK